MFKVSMPAIQTLGGQRRLRVWIRRPWDRTTWIGDFWRDQGFKFDGRIVPFIGGKVRL